MDKIKKILVAGFVRTLLFLILGVAGTWADDFNSWFEKGEEFLEIDELEQAVVAFRKALDINPNNKEAYLALADTYLLLEDYDNAIRTFETLNTKKPNDFTVLTKYLSALEEAGRKGPQLGLLKQLYNLNKTDVVLSLRYLKMLEDVGIKNNQQDYLILLNDMAKLPDAPEFFKERLVEAQKKADELKISTPESKAPQPSSAPQKQKIDDEKSQKDDKERLKREAKERERLAKEEEKSRKKAEKAKKKAEKEEKKRLAREKKEQERKEKERLALEKAERQKQARQAKEEKDRKEKERKEREKAKRKEKERLTQEKAQRKIQERLAQEEKDRKENERQEAKRKEKERLANELAERQNKERLTREENERKERERLAQIAREEAQRKARLMDDSLARAEMEKKFLSDVEKVLRTKSNPTKAVSNPFGLLQDINDRLESKRDKRLYRAKARLHFGNKDYYDVIDAYNQASGTLDDTDLLWAGLSAYANSDYSTAAAYLKEIGTQKLDSAGFEKYAESLEKSGKIKTAVLAYEALLKRYKNSQTALSFLIAHYRETSNKKALLPKLDLWLEKHPDDVNVLLEAAKLYGKRTPKGIQYTNRYLKLRPADQEVELELAGTYQRKGQTQQAVDIYLKHAENFIYDYAYNKRLADLLEKSGRKKDALPYLERCWELEQGDANIILRLATGYKKEGATDKAVHAFKQLLSLKPNNKKYQDEYLNLARRHSDINIFKEALFHVISYDEKAHSAHYELAKIQLKEKNKYAAYESLSQALRYNPTELKYQKLVPKVIEGEDQIRQYAKVLTKLADLPDADVQTQLMAARALALENKLVAAGPFYRKVYGRQKDLLKSEKRAILSLSSAKHFREAADLASIYLVDNPDDFEVRAVQIKSLKRTGASPDMLRTALNELVTNNPGTEKYWLQLAKLDLKAGDRKAAIKHAKIWVERNFSSLDGYRFLETLLAKEEGEREYYINVLGRLIELEPKKASERRLKLGNLMIKMGREYEAESILSKVTKVYGGKADLWYKLGELRAKPEISGNAKAAFRKAFKLNSNNSKYARSYGKYLESNSELKANLALFRLLSTSQPTREERLKYAKSLYLNSQYGPAAGEWKKLLEANKDLAMSEPFALKSLLKAGRVDDAVRYAANQPQDASFYIELASKYDIKGNKKNAAEYYQKAVDLKPGHTKILDKLARLYESLREVKKAVLIYDKLLEKAPADTSLQRRFLNLIESTGRDDIMRDGYLMLLGHDGRAHAAFFGLAELNLKSGNKEAAYEALSSALQINNSSEYQALLPKVIYTDEQIHVHLGAFEKIANSPGASAELMQKTARGLALKNKFRSAAKLYAEVYGRKKQLLKDDQLAVVSLFRTGDYRKASDLAEMYLSGNPSDTKVMEMAITGLGKTNAPVSKQRKAVQRLVRQIPDTRKHWLNLARLDLKSGDKAAAIKHAKIWVERNPSSKRGFEFLEPLVSTDKNERNTYVLVLEKLIALDKPKSAGRLFKLGKLLVELGRDREAEAAFSRISKAYEKNAEYWYMLGSLQSKPDIPGDAEGSFRRAYRLKKDDVNMARAYGKYLKSDRGLKAGIELFKLLSRHNPTHQEKIKLAKSYALNGKYAAAANQWKYLLDSDRQLAVKEPLSLKSLIKAKRIEEAVKYADMMKGDYTFNKLLAEQYEARGNRRKALEFYGNASAVKPNQTGVIQKLAELYVSMGETSKAMGAYEKLISLKPKDAALQQKYFSLAAGIKGEGAKRKAYEVLLSHNPKFHKAYYELAKLDLRKNNKPTAYSNLKAALEMQPANSQYMDLLPKVIYNDDQIRSHLSILKSQVSKPGASIELKQKVARGLAIDKQPKAAAKIYKQVYISDKSVLKDDKQAVQSLYGAGDYRAAAVLSEMYLSGNPSDTKVMQIAINSLRKTNAPVSKQRKAVDRLVRQIPDTRKHWLNLAKLDLKSGDKTAAIKHAKIWVERNPSSKRGFEFLEPLVSTDNNERETYVGVLEKLIDLDRPKAAGRLFKLGKLLIELKRHREAEAAFSRISKAYQNNAEYWYMLGSLQSRPDIPGDAEGSFRRAYRLKKGDVKIARAYGKYIKSDRGLKAGLELFKLLSRHNPAHQEKIKLAKSYALNGQYPAAANQWKFLLDSDRQLAVKEPLALKSLIKARRIEDAVKYADMMKGDYTFNKLLAEQYEARGNRRKALEFYGNASAIKPDQTGVIQKLAELYVYLGEREKAIDAYKKLISRKPKDKALQEKYLSLAAGISDDGARQKAYEMLLSHNPNSHKAYYELAKLALKRNIKPMAYSNLKSALKIQPANSQYMALLPKVIHNDDQIRIHLSVLKSQVSKPGASMELKQKVARGLAIDKQPKAAAKIYKQVYVRNKSVLKDDKQAVRSLYGAGDYRAAAALSEMYLSGNPSDTKVMLIAINSLKKTNAPASKQRKAVERLVRKIPDTRKHWLTLAKLDLKTGDKTAAIKHAKIWVDRNPASKKGYEFLEPLVSTDKNERENYVSVLEKLIDLDKPKAAGRLFKLGKLKIGLRRYREAEAAFSRIGKAYQNNAAYWYMLGSLQARPDIPGDAEGSFRKAYRLKSGDVKIARAYGKYLKSDKGLKAGLGLFKLLSRHKPTHQEKIKLAKSYALNGQYPAAANLWKFLLVSDRQLAVKEPLAIKSLIKARLIEEAVKYADLMKVDYAFNKLLAEQYEARGNRRKAVEFYGNASAIKPNNTYIIQKLADLYVYLGERGKAMASYEKLISLNPKDNALQEKYLSLASKISDDAAKRKAYTVLLSYNPKSHKAYYQLARMALKEKNKQNAYFNLNEALKFQPKNKDYLSLLPKAIHNDEQIRKHLSVLKSQVSKPGASIELKQKVARGLAIAKQPKAAAKIYKQVYISNKSALKDDKQAVRSLYGAGDYRAAATLAEMYLTGHPRDKEVMTQSIKSLKRINAPPVKQRRAIERLVRLEPDTKNWWLELAALDLKVGDKPSAIEHGKKWIERNPSSGKGYLFLEPLLRVSKGHEELTIKVLQKLIAIYPKKSTPRRYRLGMILYKSGRKAAAEAQLAKVTNTYSKDAKFWYVLGSLRKEENIKGTGKPELGKAVRLNPTNVKYARDYGRLLKKNPELKANLKVFELLGRNQPGKNERIKLAKARYFNGLFKRSASLWSDLLLGDKTIANDEPISVRSFMKAGMLKEAALYGHIFEKDFDFNLGLADALYKKGMLKDAAKYYRRADKAKPGQFRVLVKLAKIYAKLGQYASSLNNYRTVIKMVKDNEDLIQECLDVAEKMDDPRRLGGIYSFILETSPKSHRAHAGLARIAIKNGERRKALKHLRRAMAGQPNNKKYLALLPYTLETDADIKENFKAIKLLAASPSARSNVKLLAARGYWLNGQKAQAAGIFQNLLRTNPSLLKGSKAAIQALYFVKSYRKALELTRNYLIDKPNDIDIRMIQVNSLKILRAKPLELRSALAGLVALIPNTKKYWLDLAKADYAEGDKMSAVSNGKKWLERNPKSREGYIFMEKLLAKTPGHNKIHIAVLKHLIRTEPAKANDRLFRLGMLHYQIGQLKTAESILSKLTKAFGYKAKLWFVLGEIRSKEAFKGSGKAEYGRAYKLSPKNVLMARKYGALLKKNAELKPNLALFRLLGSRDPKVEERIKLAKAYFLNKMYKQSAEEWKVLLEIDSELAYKESMSVFSFIYSGQLEKAEKYVERYKGNYEYNYELAGYFERQNQPGKAISLYEKASSLKPKDVKILESLARLYQRLNNNKGLLSAHQRLMKSKPGLEKYQKTYMNHALRTNDEATIRRAYEEVIAVNPKSFKAYFDLAKLSHKQGDRKGAFEYLNKSLKLQPLNTDALRLLPKVIKTDEEIKIYFSQISKMAKKPGASLEAHFLAARGFELKGAVKSAANYYEKVYRRQPALIRNNKQVIQTMFKAKKFNLTARLAKAYLTQNPGARKIHEIRLECLKINKAPINQRRKAQKDYVKAFPKSPALWQKLAEFDLATRDTLTAIKSLEQSLELKPKNISAWKKLASVHQARNDKKQQAKAMERWFEQTPKDHKLAFKTGQAFLASKNKLKAGDYFKKALSLWPGSGKYQKYYAMSVYNAGKHEKALPLLEKALKTLKRDDDLRWAIYKCHKILGNRAKAKSHLKTLAAFYPTKTKYVYPLSEMESDGKSWSRVKKLLGNPKIKNKLDAEHGFLLLNAYIKGKSPNTAAAYGSLLYKKFPKESSTSLPLAILFYNRKEYRKARKILRSVVRVKPSEEAYYYGGMTFYHLKEWDGAAQYLDKANQYDKKAPFYLAKAFQRTGDRKGAVQSYETYYKNSKSKSVLPDMLTLYRSLQNQKGVLKTLERLIKAHPSELKYRIEAAETYWKNREYKKAGSGFQAILKRSPRHAKANLYLGIINARKKPDKTALLQLGKGLEKIKGNGEAWKLYGDCNRAVKKYDKALSAYKTAFRLDNKNLSVAFSKLEIIKKLGKTAELKRAYEDMIRLDPKHDESAHALGGYAYKARDYEKCIKMYGIASRGQYMKRKDWERYGMALLETKKFRKAGRAFQKAVDLGADGQTIRINLAKVYMETGEIEKAELNLKKITKKNPKAHLAYYWLASLATKRNQNGIAVDYLLKARKYAKNEPRYAEALGKHYLEIGEWKKTIGVLRPFRSKLTVPGLGNFAEALFQYGSFTEAVSTFRSIYQKEPSEHILSRLVESYAIIGKGKRGISLIERSKFKNAASVQLSWAKAVFTMGDYEKAATRLVSFKRELRNEADYHMILGKCFYEQYDFKKARKSFKRALGINATWLEALYYLGRCELQLGKLSVAKPYFESLKAKPQRNAKAWGNLGMAYYFFKENKPDAVKHHLELSVKAKPTPEAYYFQTHEALKKKKLKTAAKLASKAKKVNPRNKFSIMAQVEVYLLNRQYTKANASINNALSKNPNSCAMLSSKSKLNLYKGRIRDAIKLAQKTSSICPDLEVSYYLLGIANQKLKEDKLAKKYFKVFKKKGGDLLSIPAKYR